MEPVADYHPVIISTPLKTQERSMETLELTQPSPKLVVLVRGAFISSRRPLKAIVIDPEPSGGRGRVDIDGGELPGGVEVVVELHVHEPGEGGAEVEFEGTI